MGEVYLALVHYPVYNKHREIIPAALTTIDMHDLARLAATYGLSGLFIVTPLEDQIRLARDMIDHWSKGPGKSYNQDRAEALNLVTLAHDISEAAGTIKDKTGAAPKIVGTAAAGDGNKISFSALLPEIEKEEPILILFGTAWGLAKEALDVCDFILEPIKGPTNYNHLSVRSAAGIILDRLFGVRG